VAAGRIPYGGVNIICITNLFLNNFIKKGNFLWNFSWLDKNSRCFGFTATQQLNVIKICDQLWFDHVCARVHMLMSKTALLTYKLPEYTVSDRFVALEVCLRIIGFLPETSCFMSWIFFSDACTCHNTWMWYITAFSRHLAKFTVCPPVVIMYSVSEYRIYSMLKVLDQTKLQAWTYPQLLQYHQQRTERLIVVFDYVWRAVLQGANINASSLSKLFTHKYK
jgi:hypothetical protein